MPRALIPSRYAPNMADECRRTLPVPIYLNLLHAVATTGRMPLLDENNNPTGKFSPCDEEQRLACVRYLLDKVMPNAKPRETDEHANAAIAAAERLLGELSTDEIRRIASPLESCPTRTQPS